MNMMHILWITSSILFSGVTYTAADELYLAPEQPVVNAAVERNTLLRCFVSSTSRSYDPRLKWFGPAGQEIRETSARVYVEEDGLQSLKLYITDIQASDAGRYECRGEVEGTPTSKSIMLELYEDIRFTNAPTPQHPVIHTDALIQCEVTGNPTPVVSWKFRGQKIENDERYDIDPLLGLRIADITEDDNGQYQCRAEVESNGNFQKVDIDVIVHTPPTITKEVGFVEGVENQEVSISCQADGNPPPQYNFYKDDAEFPVSSVDDRVFVDHAAGVIDFRPLYRGDEGRYRCEADNTAGIANSNGELDVIIPPKIYDYKNISATEHETATLRCFSEGDPSPEMTFRKIGLDVDWGEGEHENGRIVVHVEKSGETHLTISDLIPTDMANYTCKSRNRAGLHEVNGTITVNFRPRFPEQERDFYGWAGKTRNITCQTLAEPAPVFRWLQYGREIKESNETFKLINLIKNHVLQVYVREEDITWIYSDYVCEADNDVGEKNELVQTFHRAMPPDQPDSAEVVEDTPTTVLIEVEPSENDGGVPIIGYTVAFGETVTPYNLDDDILIENLRPSTTYYFMVSTRNEVGQSEPYVLQHEMPDISRPYPIVIISDPEGLYPYEYTLIWEKPRTGGIPIEEYKFSYRRVTVSNDESWTLDEPLEDWRVTYKDDNPDAAMHSYKLQGLQPNEYYQVEIQARNDIGWSEPNQEFIFLTADDPNRPGGAGGFDGSNGDIIDDAPLATGSSMTTAVIIGVVIALFLVILVIADISCYFLNNCGVTKTLCVSVCNEAEGNGEDKLVGDAERGGQGSLDPFLDNKSHQPPPRPAMRR